MDVPITKIWKERTWSGPYIIDLKQAQNMHIKLDLIIMQRTIVKNQIEIILLNWDLNLLCNMVSKSMRITKKLKYQAKL
jgi:hypothetical protein